MISPEEIKVQALKWWKPFLITIAKGEDFFPRRINRIGRVQAGDITNRFGQLKEEINLLHKHSKATKGAGYQVISEDQNFRRTGIHTLPAAIEFETDEDFVSFVGKKAEWKRFCRNLEKISGSIPGLRTWASDNCLWLTRENIDWDAVLKVCHYFMENPRPDLYIRQLPVEVHTKFIEHHSALFQSLLDFLIPEHIRERSTSRFAGRYYLRYDEPLIRLRYLDVNENCAGFSDISLPVSDFESTSVAAGNVIITENKMNFLTLPFLPSTVAIWSGGGFQISFLKNVQWLIHKNIFYWGDIDEHGFQILHQLRSYYPEVKSVMMDGTTFEKFKTFAVEGAHNVSENLPFLTPSERDLFAFLKSQKQNRLEQEKIPQAVVEKMFLQLV